MSPTFRYTPRRNPRGRRKNDTHAQHISQVRTAWRTWEARSLSLGSPAAQDSASLMILLGRSAVGTSTRPTRWCPRDSRPSAVLGWPRILALIAATAFSRALAGRDHPASLRAARFASS